MAIRKKTSYIIDQELELLLEPLEDSISVKETPDGYEVRYLTPDEMAESPDEWGDDNLFLVNYHRDFEVHRDKIITEDDVREWYCKGEKIPQEEEFWIFPLSCLVHSGVLLSLNRSFACDSGGWDTSHVGVVLVSRKEAKNEDKALLLAEGLTEEWNEYLSGDVYCTVVEKFDGDKKPLDYNVVGGFHGYKYALEELKGV